MAFSLPIIQFQERGSEFSTRSGFELKNGAATTSAEKQRMSEFVAFFERHSVRQRWALRKNLEQPWGAADQAFRRTLQPSCHSKRNEGVVARVSSLPKYPIPSLTEERPTSQLPDNRFTFLAHFDKIDDKYFLI